jgi:hypothetical protein
MNQEEEMIPRNDDTDTIDSVILDQILSKLMKNNILAAV